MPVRGESAVMERARAALFSPGSPWPWVAVACLALVPHLGVLANPFVLDDWAIIVENPQLSDPHAVRKIFSGHVASFLGPFGVSNYYRPMMHFFNYCIYRLFGPAPLWFHFFCLLLHAGISLLVMAVVRRMSESRPAGLLAGLLFAVHPANTEVVAWIACSPDLLASFFVLLALLFYFRCTEATGGSRVAWLAAMGAALLLADLSKEIGLLLPLVVVVYEAVVRRRPPAAQLKERRAEYAVLAVVTLAYLAARTWAVGGLLPVQRRAPLAFADHLYTAVALFYRYAALAVWPARLSSLRYYWPNHGPLEGAVILGWLSAGLVAGLAVWLCRRRSPHSLALLLYLLPLAPMFQLPYLANVLLMIERGMYLALAGFCWLAAAALVTAGKRFGAITAAVVAAVVLLGYTGRSAARIPEWGDEIGLFREGLKDAPDPFHPSLYLGEALLRHQRPAEAVAVLNEALRLRPGYPETHNDLGRAWLELGDAERAAHHYRRAAEIWTGESRRDFAARAWNNLGIARRAQQRHGEAIAAYRQALRLDPDLALARNNLGYTLLVENQVEQAVEELRAALARQPGFWQARANLGLAYAMRGQWDPALAELAEAERLSPDNPEVQARIGEVCLARGDRQGARRWFIRALAREPQNARARAGMEAVKRP